MRRTQEATKEAFITSGKAAEKLHLQINQEKTKYIPKTKKGCVGGLLLIETDSYKFETAYFYLLGIKVQLQNDISTEIKKLFLQVDSFMDLRNF
jgi:hypothetical protein